MATMNKISPCLWFDDQAEEAAKFYTSIFEDSGIDTVARYGREGFDIHGQPEGKVMVVAFRIAGQTFTALNGGPQFKFSEAISLQVYCESQDEVDYYWSKLSEGGEEGPCGWLKDRFGLSWQVVPTVLTQMLMDPDAAKVDRLTKVYLRMQKFDIAALQRAFEGT